MKNILYCMILYSTALISVEQTSTHPFQEIPAAAEEFPTVAINLTIHNNHQLKQSNANSSSIEQTVNEEKKEGKDGILPDSLARFIRILGGIVLR